jgi:hypothetical protein
VRNFKIAMLLALACIGITSLGGCVVEGREDGGLTIRPMHFYYY